MHSDLPGRLAKVVHLYLSVAHTEFGDHEPHEHHMTVELARQWAPECDREEIEAIVNAAYVANRAGTGQELETIAEDLCTELPVERCAQILRDLGLIARAEGHLSVQEAHVIRRVRAAFRRCHRRAEA